MNAMHPMLQIYGISLMAVVLGFVALRLGKWHLNRIEKKYNGNK